MVAVAANRLSPMAIDAGESVGVADKLAVGDFIRNLGGIAVKGEVGD